MLQYDDELWVIKMEVVTRPFVLDFAGAYLDKPPDYPEEVLADWRTEKQEQFGDRWPNVELILSSLERTASTWLTYRPAILHLPSSVSR
ncbi:MAG: hypothetical protein ACC628_26700 [Pirellulaceae bacterium]